MDNIVGATTAGSTQSIHRPMALQINVYIGGGRVLSGVLRTRLTSFGLGLRAL